MKPDAVYDASASYAPWWDLPEDFRKAYCAWLNEHGIDHIETWRTEHYLIDAPFVRVYQPQLNEDGKLYCPRDHDHMTGKVYNAGEEPSEDEICEIAQKTPSDVLIRTSPPEPKDYPAASQ